MLTFADVTINVCWLYMLTIFSDDDLTLMTLLMRVLMMALCDITCKEWNQMFYL